MPASAKARPSLRSAVGKAKPAILGISDEVALWVAQRSGQRIVKASVRLSTSRWLN